MSIKTNTFFAPADSLFVMIPRLSASLILRGVLFVLILLAVLLMNGALP